MDKKNFTNVINGLNDPSSTSWGSEVRVLYRPLSSAEIRRDESNSEYHSCTRTISTSGWKKCFESITAFYLAVVLGKALSLSSAALTEGTALHDRAELSADKWEEKYRCIPDKYLTATGRRGKDADKWVEENTGPDVVILTPQQMAVQHGMWKALTSHRAAAQYVLEPDDQEVSIRFNLFGWPTRCRPDIIKDGKCVDLKTTADVDLRNNWGRTAVKFMYHLQDYIYQRGMEVLGHEAKPLRFVVVSKKPINSAHEVICCTLPQRLTDEAGRVLLAHMQDVEMRLELDHWLPAGDGEEFEIRCPQTWRN